MKRFFNVLTILLWLSSFLCAHSASDLIEVTSINPHVKLDIRYATTNNFTHQAVYPAAKCYVRRSVAEKLNDVQKELEGKGLGLKIFDGYRQQSVQYRFWELVPDERYVANPAKNGGGKHNRGAAVDLTLIDLEKGTELEMPSGFDDFTEKAHRVYDKMAPTQAKNCRILEDVMVKHGFIPYSGEWWHFNDSEWQKYEVSNVSFEELEKKA